MFGVDAGPIVAGVADLEFPGVLLEYLEDNPVGRVGLS